MIYYFIGCFHGTNTGFGGHYYSLMHLRQRLTMPSRIVVIGDFFPPALASERDVNFVKCSRLKLTVLSTSKLGLDEKPSLIHSFDLDTAVIGGRVVIKYNIPIVVTKPGGAWYRRPYLPFDNQIVFHKADYDRFSTSPFRPSKLTMIPQRVVSATIKNDRDDVFDIISKDETVRVLCVSRISPFYEEKILQAISLAERMQEYGIKAILAIVGFTESKNLKEKLISRIDSKTMRIFDSEEYVTSASDFITYADVVVGAGRSFMEGMSLGKFCFFPVAKSKLPCFATERNIITAVEQNFSSRLLESDIIDPERSFEIFMDLDDEERMQYGQWANNYFDKEFSVIEGAKLHKEFYSEASRQTKVSTILINASLAFATGILSYCRRQLK